MTLTFRLEYAGLTEDKLRELMAAVEPFAEYNKEYSIDKTKSRPTFTYRSPADKAQAPDRNLFEATSAVDGQTPKAALPEVPDEEVEIEPVVNEPDAQRTQNIMDNIYNL